MQCRPNSTVSPADAVESARLMPSPETVNKERRLRGLMLEMGSVLVAYSGGVDSSYLAYIANAELSTSALCVLGVSPSVSVEQKTAAENFATEQGLNFETIETFELEDPRYTVNPANRCYFCKSELYGKLCHLAGERQVKFVLDGSNCDDQTDMRPGRTAASELNVRSPLADVGMTKADIRSLSRAAGLGGWDKPSNPCLASRIAYGVPVTIDRLSKIELGEKFLRSVGFREFRVRVHGSLVRLEVSPVEMERALNLEFSKLVTERFKRLGFKYVTLDLAGFRSGSMNEVLQN